MAKAAQDSRPHDLPPVGVLAAKHSHGHKMRYLAGCRCAKCRKGNALYEAAMQRDREKFGPNDIVSTAPVRKHLIYLQGWGIGFKTAAKHSGVGKTALGRIVWGGKKWMRRRNAKKVLALKPSLDNMPMQTQIDSTETVAKIRQMVKWGIPRGAIATDCLGSASRGLQVAAFHGKRSTVMVKTARKVRDYFARVLEMRRIWVEIHGRIPKRNYPYWKKGRHGMTVRSFELREFAVTYDYANTWSPELKQVSRIKNKLQTKIRSQKRNAA
jgi:hypothetical protein